MCLTLTENSARLKKNLRRRKGPIKAYKILKKNIHAEFCSLFQGTPWYKDLIIKDFRSSQLTPDEIFHRKVDYGYHFFLNKEDIKICHQAYKRTITYYCPIINGDPEDSYCECSIYRNVPNNFMGEFEIDPKDIIAVGRYQNKKEDNIVAITAKFIGIVEETNNELV